MPAMTREMSWPTSMGHIWGIAQSNYRVFEWHRREGTPHRKGNERDENMSVHFKFSRMSRAFAAGALSLSLVIAPATALACTQVYVGSDLTSSGDTIYGRSEDAANRYIKQFGVEQATAGKTYWSGENGPDQDPAVNFTRTSPGATFRYTYVRDLPSDWDDAAKPYSEAGINEKGVTVDSTLTTAVNDAVDGIDPLLENGIGEYNIADVVLSEASTAREGVQLLGSIIDAQGSQDCNQIWIGDPDEVWNFQQLSGHQWIAIRMDSDVASVNPNMSCLQYEVDINDATTCLHSANLVAVPTEAGTIATFEGGAINVAKSYGLENDGVGQNTRYVQGHKYFGDNLVAGTDYTLNDKGQVESIADPQLFFQPGSSDYTLTNVLRATAARGEGTDVDANANANLYAIGNNRTVESHIFQCREGLDDQLATVQWTALSRGEFSVFVPSYSALLTETDADYYPSVEALEDGTDHVGYESERNDAARIATNEARAMEDADSKALAYVFMDLNTLAYNHRADTADGVHAYLDALQAEIIEQQDSVDELMQTMQGDDARTDFANKANAVAAGEIYDHAHALLTELRAYLSAGDFSTPFASAGLDAQGKLVDPVTYASEMTQYAQGDEVEGATMYRLYNPNSGEHFYTASTSERQDVIAAGWTDEGEGWVAPVESDEPVYRVYNPNGGDHHYTTSLEERDILVSLGWRDEGIGWYSAGHDATPVWREYNPNAKSGAHNFTTSWEEHAGLINLGWSGEGIAWYAL